MVVAELSWRLLPLVVLAPLAVLYLRGWLRLRQRQPTLVGAGRLVAFAVGLGLVAAAHLPPLYVLSEALLLGRSLQKIAVCLLAPPLIWLALPLHVSLWGLSARWRYSLTRQLWSDSTVRRAVRAITAPGFTWLLFISAFCLWHDVAFANWSMARAWRHHLTLWSLFVAALFYWEHVVGTGLRLQRRLPGWLFFAYLIGADIPNMVSGVTIAFADQPIYAYYAAVHAATPNPFNLGVIDDQVIAGGLVWCVGSFIYFGSAVLVVRKLFKDNHGDAPQPFPNWDSDERMIAPGLEHRVLEKRWREAEMKK